VFRNLAATWHALNRPDSEPVLEPVFPLEDSPDRKAGAGMVPDSDPQGVPFSERQAWARSRAVAIVNAGHADSLTTRWQELCPEIPTFKEVAGREIEHTDDQLDELAALMAAVEQEHGLSFPDEDPTRPAQFADLSARFGALNETQRAELEGVCQAKGVCVPTLDGRGMFYAEHQAPQVRGWLKAIENR
jgi:hypothetical protein